ncbi:MAG: 4Fe-4S binding protein [Candidatus Thorarchaeota archaeon]
MCDYCTKHGAGECWYNHARNYSKELASTDHVCDFCESYFSREVPARDDGFKSIAERIAQPIGQDERDRVDERYNKYLHHQIVTSDEARQVLELASLQTDEHERSIVQFPCICRHSSYGSDDNLRCLGVAFSYTYTRRFPTYLGGSHRYMSAEEAIVLLDEWAKDESIVHAVSALGVPYIGMLCNCDMNVCRPYIHRQRLGISSPWYKGHYAARVDDAKCEGCGVCEERCPFEVIKLDSHDHIAVLDPEECHGCGVCTKYCESDALSLVEYSRSSGH